MGLRILLIADVPDWAFDNIARNIIAHQGEGHQITIAHMADFIARPSQLITRHFLPGSFDLIHFFWRDDLKTLLDPMVIHQAANEAGVSVMAVIDAICAPALTLSVYDHLHLTPDALADRAGALHFVHAYSTSSPILDDIYHEAAGVPAPDAMIPDGVRRDFFRPGDGAPEGVAGQGGPLVVGWVGNSAWGAHSHDDAKGLHTILKPAIDRLGREGVAVTAHFADIQDRRRNRDEMATYYREIDVLVCASLIEGTPNPVLEAMAAGVAVVSTDVGIVRKALGPLQAQMILATRSPEAMADALRRLAEDRALLARLKAENLSVIPAWDWAVTTQGWPDLWALARSRSKDARLQHFRTELLRETCRNLIPHHVGAEDIPTWHPPLRQRLRQRAVDWLYARPRLARTVNRLRGRKV